MSDVVKDIYTAISKQDVLTVAKELGLKVQAADRTAVVIELILDDIEENGVPETEDMSDIMKRLFIVAKVIDEKGELLPPEEDKESVVEVEKLPECFGMADEFDPACKKCKVLQKCKVERQNNVPPCFGKLFEVNANECSICIENVRCRKVLGL